MPTLAERYRGPADLPQRIPVFPLRGAILLPRAVLPLNVFEPRYLAMLDDVMSGSRVLGIVQPASGESGESPAGKSVELRRVGCVGRVTAYQELDDGRLAIALTGIARCTLAGEVATAKPYRLFTVGFERFLRRFRRRQRRGRRRPPEPAGRAQDLPRGPPSARRLVGDLQGLQRVAGQHAGHRRPYGPEEKQALLEAPT